MIDRQPSPTRLRWSAPALSVGTALLVVLPALPAAAQFTVAGRKVSPQEVNFAGLRYTSPRYGLVVQINHDAKLAGDFELNLVDEAYATLLGTHQSAQVPADLLPLVFVSDTKMARFGEGGRRRIFRWLEPTMQLHPDIHLSPAAIFVSDENLKDRERLRSALTRALSFLFDRRFREALDSMERPIPDK